VNIRRGRHRGEARKGHGKGLGGAGVGLLGGIGKGMGGAGVGFL